MINRNQAIALHEQLAKMGTALSCPQRLRLLNLLCQSERSVETIAQAMSLSVATVSHHLQHLRNVRLVTSRKVGRFVTYALAGPEVVAFWLQYRDFCSSRLAEFQVMRDDLVAQRKARGVVDRRELQQLLKNGEITLLDLRPQLEFDAGHLPGAISCPIQQLAERLAGFPQGKTLVLYCRGPLCLLADIAQEQLAAKGIKSLQFTDGVTEWASAGLPIKRSSSYRSLFTSEGP
ncbi:MAG: metalloregulator ArsR/SmtB family transcription factor [Verrucomicrobia bacterium]|nr:metalloregulator ArsR/SmtB family transcription factor [Verrucomicrobiota bacterium]